MVSETRTRLRVAPRQEVQTTEGKHIDLETEALIIQSSFDEGGDDERVMQGQRWHMMTGLW